MGEFCFFSSSDDHFPSENVCSEEMRYFVDDTLGSMYAADFCFCTLQSRTGTDTNIQPAFFLHLHVSRLETTIPEFVGGQITLSVLVEPRAYSNPGSFRRTRATTSAATISKNRRDTADREIPREPKHGTSKPKGHGGTLPHQAAHTPPHETCRISRETYRLFLLSPPPPPPPLPP